MSTTTALRPAILERDGYRHMYFKDPSRSDGEPDFFQGSMRKDQPFDLHDGYGAEMMSWLMFFDPAIVPRLHSVHFGVGVAQLPKFCLRQLGMRTTAVELSPEVISMSHEFFHLPKDHPNLTVINADAAEIARSPAWRSTAHALLVDLYDVECEGPVLDSVEFYADCRELLVEGGVMTLNVVGRSVKLSEVCERIASVFGAEQVWLPDVTSFGNATVVAGRNVVAPDPSTLSKRVELIEYCFGIRSAPSWPSTIRRLRDVFPHSG
ncbi:MAG TPA: spermidine synthase [Burkholderiaceae bacterium]|nr:spermidine synthase [Burkholderiaceae bacterium]